MTRPCLRAVLVAFLAWSLPSLDGHASCLLRVAWEPYGHYSFVDDSGRPTGADIELISRLAEDVGCDVRFRELPWARILVEIEQGSVDWTASASWTSERASFAFFSTPYREAQVAIFVRRGSVDRLSLRRFAEVSEAGFRLGVVTGYYYGPEFEALMNEPEFAALVDPAADYETNIRKLLHGRIDGFLVDDVDVMTAHAGALGVRDQVERHPLRIGGEGLRFMFSQKSVDRALVAAIDKAIGRMMAAGELRDIIDKHLEKSTEKRPTRPKGPILRRLVEP